MVILESPRARIVGENPQQGEHFPHYLEGGITTTVDKAKFTRNSNYPIFAQLFGLSNLTYASSYDFVDFDKVIQRMMNASKSLWADFYEESRFLPWLRINALFFQYGFFNRFIYIHWSEELEKYLLLYKCSASYADIDEDLAPDEDGVVKFTNILTNKLVVFQGSAIKEIVRFSWDGTDLERFQTWFDLAFRTEVNMNLYHQQCLLWNKNFTLKRQALQAAVTEEAYNSVKGEMVNLSPFFTKTGHESLLECLPTKPTVASDIDAFVTAHYKVYDRETSELGRVANLNPKQERKTAGENYIAVDQHADHLRAIQDQLDLMMSEMKDRGWPPLEFKVNTEESLGLISEEQSGGKGDSPSPEDVTSAPSNSQ